LSKKAALQPVGFSVELKIYGREMLSAQKLFTIGYNGQERQIGKTFQ